MKTYTEIIITPEELKEKYLICKSIVVPQNHEVLVMGIVVYEDHTPAGGTSVIISKIDSNQTPITTTKIGFVITDAEGKFITYLEKTDKVDYLLEFYPPS